MVTLLELCSVCAVLFCRQGTASLNQYIHGTSVPVTGFEAQFSFIIDIYAPCQGYGGSMKETHGSVCQNTITLYNHQEFCYCQSTSRLKYDAAHRQVPPTAAGSAYFSGDSIKPHSGKASQHSCLMTELGIVKLHGDYASLHRQ